MSRARRVAGRPLLALGLACSNLAGCGAGWRSLGRVASLGPGELPPRQQVQIWSRGRASHWHGVVVTADAVSGIPYVRPLSCDSCRLAVPRTEVDSLRLGSPAAGFWKSVGLVVGGALVLIRLKGWYIQD